MLHVWQLTLDPPSDVVLFGEQWYEYREKIWYVMILDC